MKKKNLLRIGAALLGAAALAGCSVSDYPEVGTLYSDGTLTYSFGYFDYMRLPSYYVLSCDTSAEYVTIPDEVEGYPVYDFLGDGGIFFECKSLKQIVFGENIKFVDSRSCSSYRWNDPYVSYDGLPELNTVVLGSGMQSISSEAFAGCTALETVTFNDCSEDGAFKNIESDAFYECSSLTHITLPSSTQKITSQAFYGCPFEEFTVPKNTTEIGDMYLCYNLQTLTVEEGNSVYYSDGNCVIERETGKVALGGVGSVIPSDGSVKAIGRYAFYRMHELNEDFVIPASVTSIESAAFYFEAEGDEFGNISQMHLMPEELRYEGTVAQWGNMELGRSWIYDCAGTSEIRIVCSDGTLTVSL